MAVRLKSICVALAAVLLLAGCGGGNRFDVMERAVAEDPLPVRAVVPTFQDERGLESWSHSPWTYIPLLFWGSYAYDRHDVYFGGSIKPFPEMFAEDLAERLQEAGVFQSVRYVNTLDEVKRGDYDVIVDGTLLETTAKGITTRYGLSIIGDILHELAIPYQTRKWLLEADLQLVNAYTGEPISESIMVTKTTGRVIYTRYWNKSSIKDLEGENIDLWDEFIDFVWREQPNPQADYWVQLKEQGDRIIAAERREAEFTRKGSPPTFQFLSPAEGSVIRSESTNVSWSLAAPGNLRSITMTVNGKPIDLGVRQSYDDPDSAPVSIATRESIVPLEMGDNMISTVVTDHRGNETQASLNLMRMPTALVPEARYALLLGGGASYAEASAQELQTVLGNALVGQFASSDIYAITRDQLDADGVERAIRTFSRQPLASEFAVVYIATSGNWENLTVGDGSINLNDLVGQLDQSLATDEVLLMLDINWSGSSDEDLDDRLPNLPARWAVLVPNPNGGASSSAGGISQFAETVVSVLRGQPGETERVTLERFVDEVIDSLYQSTGGDVEADVYGRFNPSISLVERQ